MSIFAILKYILSSMKEHFGILYRMLEKIDIIFYISI